MMLGPGLPRWCRPEAAASWLLRLPWLRQAVALLRRAVAEFRADHCPQMAAAMSYHVLFSLFPLAILAAGIIGLVTQDPHPGSEALALRGRQGGVFVFPSFLMARADPLSAAGADLACA